MNGNESKTDKMDMKMDIKMDDDIKNTNKYRIEIPKFINGLDSDMNIIQNKYVKKTMIS